MRRIREIFLTQYIGAIVIGMLVVQGLGGLISLLVQPLLWYQQSRSSRSSFALAAQSFPWGSLLPAIISVGLYFVVSYLFLAWLYPAEQEVRGKEEESTQESGGE